MAKQQALTKQLSLLFKSLRNFFAVLLEYYGPYLKVIAIVLLAYIAYRIGRFSTTDLLQRKVSQIKNILQNRPRYIIQLPQRLNHVTKLRNILIILSVIFGFSLLATHFFKIKSNRKLIMKGLMALTLLSVIFLVITWVYEVILTQIIQRGKKSGLHVNEQLYSLGGLFGQRANGLLKIFLCKQKILKRKVVPAGVCAKEKCQQHRQLLNSKTQCIQALVQNTLTFEWCSVCRKKAAFNQFLDFRAALYEKEAESEEKDQVKAKNRYLLDQLHRMVVWVNEVSPCNCSSLYLQYSIKAIQQYKQREKQIETSIEIFNQRKFS